MNKLIGAINLFAGVLNIAVTLSTDKVGAVMVVMLGLNFYLAGWFLNKED